MAKRDARRLTCGVDVRLIPCPNERDDDVPSALLPRVDVAGETDERVASIRFTLVTATPFIVSVRLDQMSL